MAIFNNENNKRLSKIKFKDQECKELSYKENILKLSAQITNPKTFDNIVKVN